MAQIDSIRDLSPQALGELKTWLEPWFLSHAAPAPTPGGSGIQFETYPQAGQWLFVEATDGTAGPRTGQYAIELYDSGASTSTQILIHSDNSEIDISAGDQLGLSAGSNILIQTLEDLDIDTGGGILANLASDAVWNIDGDWALKFQFAGESFSIFKPSGPTRTFRFKADGSVWNVIGIPTVNPGGTGNIWNNGGVLNIT